MTEQKPVNPLRNIGAATARNHFNGVPVEFVVPPGTQVVFVADMFTTEYTGGAELTTEAIISKSPVKTFKVHSQSLSIDMLKRYPDVHWVICNYTQCDVATLAYLAQTTIKYSVVEYDFKYCMYRSEVMHQKQTGHACDCVLRPHGTLVEKLYMGANHIFWMSEKQKEHFFTRMPSLIFVPEDKHVVLGSVFDDTTLDRLVGLQVTHESAIKKIPVKIWGVQGSSNWIKGTQETIQWCTANKMPVKVLSNMAYDKFLLELATCAGFVFQPLDFDTCPRVVIEAKIMGLELSLNDNVLHKDEAWFNGTPDEIVAHLKTRGDFFWKHIT